MLLLLLILNMVFFGILVLYSFIYLNLHQYFHGAKLFLVLNLLLLVAILLQKPKIIPSRINSAIFMLLSVMALSVPFSSYIKLSLMFLLDDLFKIILIGFMTYYALDSTKRLSIGMAGLSRVYCKERFDRF